MYNNLNILNIRITMDAARTGFYMIQSENSPVSGK